MKTRPILLLLGVVSAFRAAAPTQLSSQSWLTYRGTVTGKYNYTCAVPEGTTPKPPSTGPFAFFFADREVTSQGGFGRGKVDADGSVSGGTGASFTWRGRFSRGSDGAIQGSGTISPEAGAIGCTGTWSAGVGVGSGATPAATSVCDEHKKRIQTRWAEKIAPGVARYPGLLNNIGEERRRVQETSRNITNIKAGTLTGMNLEQQLELRRASYALINELEGVRSQLIASWKEIEGMRAEARSAGCEGLAFEPVGHLPADDLLLEDLLHLQTAPAPPARTPTPVVGVAGIRGIVEVETRGSKGPLTNGTAITLNQPVIIRTGPGSAVTIQVGSVQKTLRPMTTIRIVPNSSGQPDFIEQGAGTVEVLKPWPYRIQTPAATATVDGTIFTVSHDPATVITGIMVYEGRVTVRPKNPELRGVTLAPGEYVQVGLNAISAVLPAPGTPETRPTAPASSQGGDLTGLWLDDSGGGAIYRVRQVGSRLYWSVDGTSKGSYSNVAFGDINGTTINLKWVDLPGSPTLSGGDLTLRIESNDRLVKLASTANYPPKAWTRQGSRPGAVTGPAPPPAPAPAPAPAPPPAPPPTPATATGGTAAPPIRPGRYLTVRVNGQTATANWSNAPTNPGTWVSMVPVGTPDGAQTGKWMYTENRAAGSYEYGPLDPGAYEARFYADAGYGKLVDRVRFNVGTDAALMMRTVQGQLLRVLVDQRSFAVLTWSNAPATKAWVSVVPAGTAESAHVNRWLYTAGTASGRFETGPLPAGEYEARFYGDEGYGKLMEKVRFRVQ